MTFYTPLIEHYLRAAVRFSEPFENQTARAWQTATRQWIDRLPEEDKHFIKQVFKYENFTTKDGITSLPGRAASNWKRLNTLERELAEHLNLIEKQEETNNGYEHKQD